MAGSGLATVMFTDLVGSTRMREQLGDDVADEIGVTHDRIIADALASSRGRLVKNLGDGALAVFDSSVDAVVAGQRIQEGVSLYNRQSDESRHIGVRIGINAGEIATDDGDVIGLPVAVASRVCDKAHGGQILITDTVRTLIGRRARFPYVSVGAHALKGVDGSVELWSIEDAVVSTPSKARADIPFPAFLARGMPNRLVGRQEQLAQLDSAFASANETVKLTAIIGEPGIGKTSLTSTWCRTAADAGATVVAGRCTPEAALPYQPFIEIARVVLGARPNLLLEVGPAAGNIAQLVPGIETPKDLPVPVQTDPDTTLYLMAEAFSSLLGSKDGERPTVVVLDDLHWADEHSIAVLAHLVRREELAALIIGTYRDTDLVRSHPLPRLLSDLRREHSVLRIPLPRLSEIEVEEMISDYFGNATAPDVVESIAQETQGNPFFIEEITTHLQDEGAIDADGVWISDTPIADYGIPEGVREVVGRRLDHLGEDAVATLEVAAVIGPDFSIDVAGAIAGIDEAAIDAVVEAAMNARVIKEADNADEFAFAHALLRQTLYEDLPTRRRIRLHRSVGVALEARGETPAVLLNHWLHANENAEALACAIAASEVSRDAFAGLTEFGYLELAFDIWEDVDDAARVAGMSHAQLVMRLSDMSFDFGVTEASHEERIRTELETDDIDNETRALLLDALASQLGGQGQAVAAREARAEALAIVPKDPPNESYAKILSKKAGNLAINAQSAQAVEVAKEVLQIARAVGSEIAEMAALSTLGTALQNLGRIEESDRYFRELSAKGQRTGSLRHQLIRYVNQASGLAQNGQLLEALALTEEGIDRTAELGVTRWEAMLRGNAAEMLFQLGRWDEAEQMLVAREVRATLDFPGINCSLAALALAAERGDDRTTGIELDRLDAFDITDLDAQFHGIYWQSRVSDLRWHGDLAEAFAIGSVPLDGLNTGDDWRDAPGLAALVIEVIADAVEHGVAEPDWVENARTWYTRFEDSSGPMTFRQALTGHAAADLARAEGNNDASLWRETVAAWGEQPYGAAKARWRLAAALAENDPSDPEITDLLNQAHDAAEHLKAQPLLDAIRVMREKLAE